MLCGPVELSALFSLGAKALLNECDRELWGVGERERQGGRKKGVEAMLGIHQMCKQGLDGVDRPVQTIISKGCAERAPGLRLDGVSRKTTGRRASLQLFH